MTLLSDPHLIVAIQGLQDALIHNRVNLMRSDVKNLPHREEYLWTLSDLASYLRNEYVRRAAANHGLPPYGELFRKPWPTKGASR